MNYDDTTIAMNYVYFVFDCKDGVDVIVHCRPPNSESIQEIVDELLPEVCKQYESDLKFDGKPVWLGSPDGGNKWELRFRTPNSEPGPVPLQTAMPWLPWISRLFKTIFRVITWITSWMSVIIVVILAWATILFVKETLWSFFGLN